MDKTRAGIVSYTAAMQRKSSIAQAFSPYGWHTKINRLRLDVKAILGYPFGMGSKKLVAPGCAVTTHNVNFGVRTADGRR
jgi:hypothetical protein